MTATELAIGRLEAVHPVRSELGLCIAPLVDPGGCRARSRRWDLVRPAFHLLLVCTEGTGAHQVDLDEYTMHPGTVTWVRPGQVHTPAPEVGGIAVCFTDAFVGDVLRDLHGSRWDLAGQDRGEVRAHLDLLTDEYDRYVFAPTGPQLARSDRMLAHQLAALLLRLNQVEPEQAERPPAAHPTADRFLDLVEQHYAQLHTAEGYAALLGCSTRTLARTCIEVCGMTPKEIIDGRRAREARRLLRYTDAPVQAVARRIGFDDAANFCRFFARTVGITPGAYRSGC
jgi:AraC-like DNA-binding protein